MAAQRGFSEKCGTAGEVGWATRAVHEHRAQIALRAGVPGVGRNSVKPSSQYIVARNGCVTRLESAGELEKRLGFSARRGKLRDRGDDGRLRSRGNGA
jgi:hypothetical protein